MDRQIHDILTIYDQLINQWTKGVGAGAVNLGNQHCINTKVPDDRTFVFIGEFYNHAKSNLSRFIRLFKAATKSFTIFPERLRLHKLLLWFLVLRSAINKIDAGGRPFYFTYGTVATLIIFLVGGYRFP